MGYIEAIRSVRNRVTVSLDSGRTFTLRRRDLEELGLTEGAESEEAELEKEILRQQYRDALSAAVSLLAARPYSEQEIRRKLIDRGFCAETADLAVYRLRKEKLLDDSDFSRQWVRYRTGCRWGPGRILRELIAKGVDEETARGAISESDPEEAGNAALHLVRKALRNRKADEPPAKARQRIVQGLVRRGYDWDTAREAYERALEESE